MQERQWDDFYTMIQDSNAVSEILDLALDAGLRYDFDMAAELMETARGQIETLRQLQSRLLMQELNGTVFALPMLANEAFNAYSEVKSKAQSVAMGLKILQKIDPSKNHN